MPKLLRAQVPPDGHRLKDPLEYSCGPDQVWVYGALRPKDGQVLTLTASSRDTAGYLRLLQAIDQAPRSGELYLMTDNLSSHTSGPIREWLGSHPRVQPVFLPEGACWLNLQEGGWRLFRREALAGQTFADRGEIAQATEVTTKQLNRRAQPWVWGRPKRRPRHPRHRFVYCL